jgi:hypothetical protein
VNESTSSDLGRLFAAALQAMEENQQAVNDLDGYNGNHGDNMVQNLRTITAALAERKGAPPSEALRYASHELQTRGKGGTSSYYVRGLDHAAERLEGRSELNRGDVMTLVQSLLGAVPSQGHSQQAEAGGSVFDQVVGLAANQQIQAAQSDSADVPESPLQAFLQAQQSRGPFGVPDSPLQELLNSQQSPGEGASLGDALGALLNTPSSEPESPGGSSFGGLAGGAAQSPDGQQVLGGLLGSLLGGQQGPESVDAPDFPLSALLGSEQPQGSDNPLGGMLGALLGGQPSQPGPQGENRPANVIQALLPAAMAFLQAKQAGTETSEALGQALMGLLTNRRMDPLQAGTPRAAAGGLVAQSILQALGS